MPPAPPPETPLCGRAAEWAALQEHLLGAMQGEGRAVLLSGEAGAGKTRLARELQRTARRMGCLVLTGQGSRLEMGLPYAIWADAVHPYLRSQEERDLVALVGRGAPHLEPVFPALAGLLPPEVIGPGLSGPEGQGADRRRGLEAVFQFLRRLTVRSPLLLVLDDLHWADQASLELFSYVARNLAGTPFLLLAAARAEAEMEQPQFAEAVSELRRSGRLGLVELGPLGDEAAAELLMALVPADRADATTLRRLQERARGNPLFLEELARGSPDGLLPRNVREILSGRLAAVAGPDREILEILAVLAARPTLGLLAAVTGRDPGDLLGVLDRGRRARLLVERQERDGVTWAFSHPLLAEALDDELGAAHRMLLHGRAAVTLEGLLATGRDDLLEAVALHYRHADPGTYRPKAARYLLEAGERCLRRHAPAEAADWLESALWLSEGPETVLDAAQRGRLLLGLGTARMNLVDTAGAEQVLAAAVADATLPAFLRARACRVMGDGVWWLSRHAEALGWWNQGLATLQGAGGGDRETEAEEMRLHLALSLAKARLGDLAGARAAAAAGHEAAAARGEPGLVAEARATGAAVDIYSDRWESALAELQAVLAMPGVPRYPAWYATLPQAVLAVQQGRSAEAVALAVQALELADQVQALALVSMSRSFHCVALIQAGRWVEAQQSAAECLAWHTRLGMGAHISRSHGHVAWVAALQGDHPLAAQHLGEARRLLRDQPLDALTELGLRVALGVTDGLLGNWEGARPELEQGLSRAEQAGWTTFSLWLLPWAAEAAMATGDPRAPDLVQALLAASPAFGWTRAWGSFLAGQGELDTGGAGAALAHLEAATAAFDGLGVPREAARSRLALARARAALGDAEAAAAAARAALEALDELGARRDADGARALLRSLGAAVHAPARRGAAADISERELEVLVLVARGLTNREIGETLYISRRTVDAHLQNLLRKLDASSRAELVAIAAARGLIGR